MGIFSGFPVYFSISASMRDYKFDLRKCRKMRKRQIFGKIGTLVKLISRDKTTFDAKNIYIVSCEKGDTG